MLCLALSGGGQKIVVGLAEGALKVLDCSTGALIFEEHLGAAPKSVAFCPNGRYFAASSSPYVRVWSTELGCRKVN